MEIFENDLLTYEGTAAEAGRMCSDLGLEVALFQPFRDFESMPEPQRARNLDRAERKFDTMEQLGARMVLVCSNVQAAALPEPERAADDLREMAERAARRSLLVGYEALAWGKHVNRWRQAWDIVRRADHPALGLILDSFHTLCLGDDLRGLAEAVPAEKLFFVQLADAPRLSMDPLSWSRHFRSFPGQGELPVADFLRDVLAAGYGGPLSLEIFNDEFRSAPARRIARDGLRSLVWAEEGAGIAALPARPVLSGIEFVEFAVDDAAAAELGAYLGTLGFRLAGRHRSKAVTLASQRRRQPRAERRAGQRRLRALRAARPLRLRHGLPGGRPGARAGAGRSDAPPHLARAHGRGRAAHPGDPRARTARWSTWWRRRHPARDRSGRTTSTSNRTQRGRGAPAASAAWTTWRRP